MPPQSHLRVSAGSAGYLLSLSDVLVKEAAGQGAESVPLRYLADRRVVQNRLDAAEAVQEMAASFRSIERELKLGGKASWSYLTAHLSLILIHCWRLSGLEDVSQLPKITQRLLEAGFERDRSLGYTGVGPQKADVRLKANGVPAQDILSRGQLKLLVCAMRLAQGLYLNQHSSRGCIFLIDDFASELDVDKRRLLAARLKQCASQVFITAIDTGQLADMMDANDCKLFHVEQGKISETLEKAESKL